MSRIFQQADGDPQPIPDASGASISGRQNVPLERGHGSLPAPPLTDSGRPAIDPRPGHHPHLDALPHWPERTVAVLGTYDGAPHAIPVASLLRAGDGRILFSLRRDRNSLARLRESPEIALTVLGDGDTAFTARGRAHVLVESLVGQPEFAAVELVVGVIEDHRQSGYSVAILWSDERELERLRERISALQWLAA